MRGNLNVKFSDILKAEAARLTAEDTSVEAMEEELVEIAGRLCAIGNRLAGYGTLASAEVQAAKVLVTGAIDIIEEEGIS